MKRTIILSMIICSLAMIIFSPAASGQKGGIKGRVTDMVTKEPLAFANIIIYEKGSMKTALTTDIEGKYVVMLAAGIYDIKVTYVGYKELLVKEVPVKDDLLVRDIELEPQAVDIKTVEIIEHKEALMIEASASYMVVEEIPARHMMRSAKKEYFGSKEKDIVSGDIGGLARTGNGAGSGILTAGEVNDFGKWKLWQDVAATDLGQWQGYWKFWPVNRYTLQVESQEGRPVVDAAVELTKSGGNCVWSAHTDNTGKAELWAGIFKDGNKMKDLELSVTYKGQTYHSKECEEFGQGINVIRIPAECAVPANVDIVFMVDATGSMSDELEYLKMELQDVIGQVKKKYPQYNLNLGCVFYRDHGDVYVTRKTELTTNVEDVIGFLKEQSAGGGGDKPEAVDEALDLAVNDLKWSDHAVARMLFLVLDAPPHNSDTEIASVQRSIEAATKKGIRIIPITGSGIDKSDEYLFRSFALATNGTYVFLTDHSGVGGAHIKPSTDEYDVLLFNDLLKDLIFKYIYVPPCNEPPDTKGVKDTMFVYNPKAVTHEIADAKRAGKYGKEKKPREHLSDYTLPDSAAKVSDTAAMIPGDSLATDDQQAKLDSISAALAEANVTTGGDLHSFKYYPNPTTGSLTIEIKGKIKEIYLADITGKLLEKYNVGEGPLKIDISKYPVGMYFLQYYCNDKWLSGKVVLIR